VTLLANASLLVGDMLIPYSGAFENALSQLEADAEKEDYCKTVGAKYEATVPVVSVLPKIILAGYNVLKLCYFFTCGPMEVRCWTIRQGTKAPQAAGVIHTDFEKVYLRVSYDQFNILIVIRCRRASLWPKSCVTRIF
jgi:obg-like ATPase 1